MPYNYHTHGYNNTHSHTHRRSSNGHVLMLVGLLIGSPFIFWLGFIEFAFIPVGLAAAGTSSALVGLTVFGLGALIFYAATGLAYLYSGARECFHSGENVLDMIKSRVINEEERTFKGVLSAIAAALWSPFLLIGGLLGMLTKTVVSGFRSKDPSNSSSDDSESDEIELDKNSGEDRSRDSQNSVSRTNSEDSMIELFVPPSRKTDSRPTAKSLFEDIPPSMFKPQGTLVEPTSPKSTEDQEIPDTSVKKALKDSKDSEEMPVHPVAQQTLDLKAGTKKIAMRRSSEDPMFYHPTSLQGQENKDAMRRVLSSNSFFAPIAELDEPTEITNTAVYN